VNPIEKQREENAKALANERRMEEAMQVDLAPFRKRARVGVHGEGLVVWVPLAAMWPWRSRLKVCVKPGGYVEYAAWSQPLIGPKRVLNYYDEMAILQYLVGDVPGHVDVRSPYNPLVQCLAASVVVLVLVGVVSTLSYWYVASGGT